MSKHATILIAPVAVMVGLVAAASFLPEQRLWGLNHLAFYPVWVRALALAIIAVTFVPAVAEHVHSILLNGTQRFRAGRRGVLWLLIGLTFASVVLFNGLQSSTLLLGDGQFISNTVELLFEEGKPGPIESIRQINVNEHIAPGTYTLNYLAGSFEHRLRGRPATDGIRRFNILLGACLVLLLGLVLLHAPMSDTLRLWFVALVSTSGAMQLFFGYVENYTVLVFLASLYVIAAFSVMYRHSRMWPVIVLAIVAAWTHVEGILLFPSALTLVAWRHGKTQPRRLKFAAAALMSLVLTATVTAARLPSAQAHFLTLMGDADYYGIFAPAHLLDLFNALVILVPSILLFVVMAVRLAGKSEPATSPNASRDDRPAPLFVAMILGPCAVFLLAFKAEIGVARDWDLFALTVVGLVPAALLLVRRFHNANAPGLRLAFAPVLVMSLVLTTAWIGINASTDRTPRRIEAILAYDRSLAPYAYETLAKHYYAQHELTDAIATLEKGAALSKNPRHQLMLSGFYREYGDSASAERLVRRIVRNHPDNVDAQRNLCIMLYEQRRFEELVVVGVPGVQLHPSDLGLHYMLARAMLEVDRIDDGRVLLQRVLTLNPPERMRREVDAILRQLQPYQNK